MKKKAKKIVLLDNPPPKPKSSELDNLFRSEVDLQRKLIVLLFKCLQARVFVNTDLKERVLQVDLGNTRRCFTLKEFDGEDIGLPD